MTDKSFTLPSFAKINWLLRILGKREDGFHELCTIFQTVSLFDEITFEPGESVTLNCADEMIPSDESNLIVQAALLLQKEFDVKAGAKIHLEKRIPAPGGLGGGSSNAAIALVGLATLWDLEIGFEKLVEIGARLGSDVPFFLYGGTALGTGRGEEIFPLQDLDEKLLLIATPPVNVSTADAFARTGAPRLTNETSKSILKICQNEAARFNPRQRELSNDFEESIFGTDPEIARVKERLLSLGAKQAILSGSGASVFALFDKEETRQAAQKALEEETNWRKFAVATVSREEYRAALKKCERLFPISF
ncbi:MAG TPA: 4-(cytidine 5'-diphospho)-2-C-methyl-D-erythritol kinase [Pyrinomonadaceae bacterium]|jgi:4-diphosphocytidyl-2-C-methyl-D-erythritol kinase